MAKVTLTAEQVQRIVRALADPNRYDILKRVYAAPKAMTCGCAKGELSISDATCSHHLKELHEAELITMERDGRHRLLTPRRDVWKAFTRQLRDF
jgi:ArsR family transcriptional regulator